MRRRLYRRRVSPRINLFWHRPSQGGRAACRAGLMPPNIWSRRDALSASNQKVEAAAGPGVQSMKPLLTVLDTGAGPNLIRADLLTPEVLASCDTTRPMKNLTSLSNHRLDAMDIVNLTVKFASCTVRRPFLVVRQLRADDPPPPPTST